MSKKTDDLSTFLLIKRDKFVYWTEKRLDYEGQIRLYNQYGGYNYLLSTDEILETVIAEDFCDLDETKTSSYQYIKNNINNKKLKCGYIDRKGIFYRCEYQSHSDLASVLFDKSQRELDDLGWIKILRKTEKRSYPACDHNITPEQFKTLSSLSFIDSMDIMIYEQKIQLS